MVTAVPSAGLEPSDPGVRAVAVRGAWATGVQAGAAVPLAEKVMAPDNPSVRGPGIGCAVGMGSSDGNLGGARTWEGARAVVSASALQCGPNSTSAVELAAGQPGPGARAVSCTRVCFHAEVTFEPEGDSLRHEDVWGKSMPG